MKRFTLLLALIASCAMLPAVALSAEDADSQSAGAVAALTAVLDAQKLDAIAARDPGEPGRYVAAFYMPGNQLLVVSAPYAAPAAIDAKIAAGQYMDVYVHLQSVANHSGHFFVIDMQADGLRRALKLDDGPDSTTVDGATPVNFDGKWEPQNLTKDAYAARFAADDARYVRMLEILRAALLRKTT